MSQLNGRRIQVSGAMRAKSAAAFLDIGESTLWRWVKEGKLPKGVRLTPRTTVWLREDLEQFLNQAFHEQRGV